jgi:hypothetical protein
MLHQRDYSWLAFGMRAKLIGCGTGAGDCECTIAVAMAYGQHNPFFRGIRLQYWTWAASPWIDPSRILRVTHSHLVQSTLPDIANFRKQRDWALSIAVWLPLALTDCHADP